MENIASIKSPNQIEIIGFELADDSAHMFGWLGRGDDFRRFVTKDIEVELYQQTPAAQLLQLRCVSQPELATRSMSTESGENYLVTHFDAKFFVEARVKNDDGVIWKLSIHHNYAASNIHVRDQRRTLTLNFNVISASQD